jgi:hypothetical protein
MAFTYSDDRSDARSRVRAGVGDITTPGLLPDATYDAVLVEQSDDEAQAIRAMAALLAAKYAVKPTQVRLVSGLTVTWERVQQWNLIARGEAGDSLPAPAGVARSARLGRLTAGCDYTVR